MSIPRGFIFLPLYLGDLNIACYKQKDDTRHSWLADPQEGEKDISGLPAGSSLRAHLVQPLEGSTVSFPYLQSAVFDRQAYLTPPRPPSPHSPL